MHSAYKVEGETIKHKKERAFEQCTQRSLSHFLETFLHINFISDASVSNSVDQKQTSVELVH